MTDPKAKPPITVVYLGARIGKGEKMLAAFATPEQVADAIAQGSELAPASALIAKRLVFFDDNNFTKRMTVGAIYQASGTLGDDGGILTLGIHAAKFQGRITDDAMTMDLEAADKAARGEKAGLLKLAAIKKDTALLRELRGLRRAYQATSGAGRVAYEIAILAALRTPVRL